MADVIERPSVDEPLPGTTAAEVDPGALAARAFAAFEKARAEAGEAPRPDPWAVIDEAAHELYGATTEAMAVLELPFGSVESLRARARAALDRTIAVQRKLREAAAAAPGAGGNRPRPGVR